MHEIELLPRSHYLTILFAPPTACPVVPAVRKTNAGAVTLIAPRLMVALECLHATAHCGCGCTRSARARCSRSRHRHRLPQLQPTDCAGRTSRATIPSANQGANIAEFARQSWLFSFAPYFLLQGL